MLRYKSSLSGSMLIRGALFLMVVNVVSAGPVKSVDENGNVTYSDKPVPGAAVVSTVPIVSGPSDAEVDAAQQQADKNINAAKKIDQKNKVALEKKKAEQAKSKAASNSEQLNTGVTTPTGNYNGADPYYYGPRPSVRPRPPIHQPRPPGNRPRPPGTRPPTTKPPVNLPAPRPRAGGR